MIVEAVGKNDVLVRYRDKDGKRQSDRITEFLPHCYLRDEDAYWVTDGKKQEGFKGLFGEKLTKVTFYDDYGRRDLHKHGMTWEANIPYTNQVLCAKKKRGDPLYESYEHRIWYLDGEWKIDTGEITMLTVHDSFTGNLYSWVVMPDNTPKGKYKHMTDKNGNVYEYDVPVLVFDNEKNLLAHFMNFMAKQDPDIITGWYVNGADIQQIVKRAQANDLQPSKMSPIRKIRYNFGDWKQSIAGRNVIDLKLAFPKLYELKNGKLSGYKLDDVAYECLGEKKVELEDGHDTYYSDPVLYLDYNRQDVKLLPKLNSLVNALEYFIAVQHIVQCEIASTPHITKVFSCLALGDPEVDFQIPSKPQFDKVDYEGAIVMDGELGIYENVGIFDVKAMYHSNASLHNISWDMLDKTGKDCGNGTCFKQDKKGLLVRQMDNMTVLRNKYKRKMKEAKDWAEKVSYDALQYATKSLVASMYGVAGDSKYGMYHPEIASAITYTSRQTLLRLKECVEKRGCKVVYGHTDSVMAEVGSAENGLRILEEINEEMFPIVNEFEKFSRKFMLVNKNRYCGLVTWTDGEYHDPQRYVKGIELKQNRMPPVMKECMGSVIDGILHGSNQHSITAKISGIIDTVICGRADPLSLCMKGKLTKNLHEYSSVSGSAAGAQWANRHLGKQYRADDYFLCAIDSKGNYMAFDHPRELAGIAEIGYRTMCERFIVKKIEPYYKLAGWDFMPILIALEGNANLEWF